MTANTQTTALLTCALLHLDPRVNDKRLELNSLLVEVALYSTGHSMTVQQIRDEIDTIVKQSAFLKADDVEEAVSDCMRRGSVVPSEGRHGLSDNASHALESAFESADLARSNMRRKLIEEIEGETGEPLPEGLARDIVACVENSLADVVYRQSLQLARESLTMEEVLGRIDAVHPLERLDETLEGQVPAERLLYRAQIKQAVLAYFRRLDPDLKQTLKLIHHTVLLNQLLNLDPMIVQLEQEWFSHRRLYLDTNVVLGWLFEGQLLHSIVKEVLTATEAMGVQLNISPITLQELGRQVTRAKGNFRSLERDPLMQRMAQHGDDAILATFVRLKRRQPSLLWDAFIAPFDNLADALLDYGILLEDEGFAEAESAPELARFRTAMEDAKPPYASEDVLTHDSLNLALIIHLRQRYPPDERGHTLWLLTIDRSLGKAQRILTGSGEIPGPYCMQVQDWGEIILPAQSVLSVVFDDFVGYLAQARLGALADPKVIQLDFLETIRDAEIDVDRLLNLHPAQVRAALVSLQADRDARALLRDAASAGDMTDKRNIQNQFLLMLDDSLQEADPVVALERELDGKLNVLRRKIEEKDNQIAELAARVGRAESNVGFRTVQWLSNLLRRH